MAIYKFEYMMLSIQNFKSIICSLIEKTINRR